MAPQSPASDLDDLIASLLRGDDLDRRAIKACGASALHEAATAHGVLPLVADRLALAPELPVDLRELFLEDLHRAIAIDMATEAELIRMFKAFARRRVSLLLFKGSHLAYTHYARSELRARIDSDILIDRAHREVAASIFVDDLGYEAHVTPSGDLSATQTTYVKYADEVAVHQVDLHWRLASPQAFAHVLTFEELLAQAEPLPALGPWARVPGGVHALLIACLHRVAHHHDEPDTFRWIYDVHLIASAFRPIDWARFADLALERELSAICLDSVLKASRWFGTVVPPAFARDARFARAKEVEPTAAYLLGRPKARALVDDLRALPGWADRRRLLGEHLFPAERYMRDVYAPGSRLPLPLLYVMRALRGIVPWFR